MNIIKIALKNLLKKALTNGLSTLLMALGVAIISLIISLNSQLDNQFIKNIKGIDMVIGAKGSPLQLILASIYQIDSPTGNINFDAAKKIVQNPFIKKAIPLALGDSYQGYRIIGTDSTYLNHFKAEIAIGKIFEKPMDCVIGYGISQKFKIKVGDQLGSSHGLDAEGEQHQEAKYTVTGLLKYNNSTLDQLIITPLESVWSVHHSAEKHTSAFDLLTEQPDKNLTNEKADNEITAMLVKFRNPMGLMTIPRNINANTNMQAALPAIEINRLLSLLGIGVEALKWLAIIIILVAGISVFVTLYNSLKERKYELALMLSMGATRFQLFLMLLIEGLFIGIMGFILGIFIGKIGLYLVNIASAQSFHYQLNIIQFGIADFLILLGCIFISTLAAALPSVGIYKLNISNTLAEQ